MVWSWISAEPFGATAPNSNPNNLGTFVFNQRFPGQVYDAETNLNQNWNREYQALKGGYTQVDPIGLQGGSMSLYTYVDGNPLKFTDPSGLVKWKGLFSGVTAAGVVGGGLFYFNLATDCLNGKQATASGIAVGSGAGVALDLNASLEGLMFDDADLTPNPNNLNGQFTAFSGTAKLTIPGISVFGATAAAITLGKAVGTGIMRATDGSGRKIPRTWITVGAIGIGGTSTVFNDKIEDCRCVTK